MALAFCQSVPPRLRPESETGLAYLFFLFFRGVRLCGRGSKQNSNSGFFLNALLGNAKEQFLHTEGALDRAAEDVEHRLVPQPFSASVAGHKSAVR